VIIHAGATKRQTVCAYVPENLDVSAHLPPMWQDYGAFFVGGLYLRRHTEKHRDPNAFYPVSSQVVRQTLPDRGYRAILDSLVGEVIEQESGYQVGVRSRGYRLAEKYRHKPFRVLPLRHETLVRKVRSFREQARATITDPVHQHIRATVERVGLVDGWPYPILALAVVANGDWFFTPCPYGRLHHNLTSMGRAARQYVQLDGRPLWALDVRNSQPFIFGMVQRGWSAPRVSRLFDFYSKALPKQRKGKDRAPPRNLRASGPDLGRYLEVCRAGQLYEVLMEEVVKDSRWRHGRDRDRLKKRFMAVIYGKAKHMGTVVGRAFQKLFPGVFATAERANAESHGWLPRQMQRVESFIVVRRAASRILAEHPDTPLITVHDSFVTHKEHIEKCENILREEFETAFGMAPAMSVKPFAEKAEFMMAA